MKYVLLALILFGCGGNDTEVIEDSHVKIEITMLDGSTVSVEETKAAVQAVLAIQN